MNVFSYHAVPGRDSNLTPLRRWAEALRVEPRSRISQNVDTRTCEHIGHLVHELAEAVQKKILGHTMNNLRESQQQFTWINTHNWRTTGREGGHIRLHFTLVSKDL